MSKKCTRLAQPGQAESWLYNTIFTNIANRDEETAIELYSEFFTDEFKEDFGDWIEDYEIRKRNTGHKAKGEPLEQVRVIQKHIDIQGEPLLLEDAESGKYYYINKQGRRKYFPSRSQGLNKYYSYSEILGISKILAFNYIKSSGMSASDLSVTEIGETLQESIKNKLKDIIDKLEKKGDEDSLDEAYGLKETINHIHQWEYHVKDYFRGLKLKYTEEQERQEIEETETETRSEQWSHASFERSTKENISTNVKLRLSLLQYPGRKDNIFGIEDVFIPFDEVYSVLLQKLGSRVAIESKEGVEDLFDIYLKEIEGIMHRKPFLKSLHSELQNADEDLKSEFVQAFNLDKNNFMTTEVAKVGPDKRRFTIMNVSSVGAKAKNIQADWYANFSNYFLNSEGKFKYQDAKFDESGKKVRREINRFGEVKKWLDIVEKKLNEFSVADKRKQFKTEADLEDFKSFVKDYMLDFVGVITTDAGFDLYLDDLSMHKKSTAERARVLEKTMESTAEMLKDILKKDIKPGIKSPLSTQNIFNSLGEAEAFYEPEGTDANIFSAGKSKWIYSKPTYISNKVKQWKKNPELLKAVLEDTYGASSEFARHLLAYDKAPGDRERISRERLNKLEVTVFNTFQEQSKSKEGVDNKSISINDFNADTINKILRITDEKTRIYSSPTPADKGTHYQIQTDYTVSANAIRLPNGTISINGHIVDIFYNYFKSEYERMKKVRSEKEVLPEEELKVHYHLGNENGLKSQLFPSLSFDRFDGISEGFELYNEDGSPALNDLDVVKEQLLDLIEAKLGKGIQDTLDGFYKKGILKETREGIVSLGIDMDIVDAYKTNKVQDYDLRMAADAYVNGMISQVEYSKLFSGDVAYYKNTVDYKKRIPATYTDGLQLRLRNHADVVNDALRQKLLDAERNFNASVIEGVEVGTPFAADLKEMLDPEIADYYIGKKNGGEDINSTDAQAWITPQRWKFLMQRMGKWDSTYEATYNKIMSGDKLKLNEADLKKVMQPLKGVYFETPGGSPTYLKYSQAVLVPRLIKGTPLETIYNKMVLDENGNEKEFGDQIHETITIDGVKVGAINPVATHDADGNMLDDFTLTSMSLPNTGWKLQQDLPTKTFKEIPVGTQIQKNIFGGLANNLDKTFLLGDTEMTGKQLIEHINSIVEGLSDKGRGALIADFGITNTGSIKDLDRVYSAMIAELRERGGNQNIIDALEGRISPYGIPQAKKTLMNIFSSMFLKRLVKIKTNGGAFIQLSNYGLSKNEAEKEGVIWATGVKNGETVAEPRYLKDDEGNVVYKEVGASQRGFKSEVVDRYSNKDLADNPDKIYLFGDNTQRKGKGGQAQIRDNANAMGIATKLAPSNADEAFMSDANYLSNVKVIQEDIAKIKKAAKGKTIVFPKDGFGTGLAKLKEKAPQTYQYLRNRLLSEFGFDNNTGKVDSTSKKIPVIQPGGVLISGSFIAKYIPDYRDHSPEKLFGKYNASTGKYEGGMIDDEIIRGLVGYRIPNQGMASNDALQIAGILPEEMGDTIVAYTGITTKTGSDFDIDKMYLMMPSFVPYRKLKSPVRNYVIDYLKGDTKPEVVNNINRISRELGLDTDVDGLANLLMGTDDKKKFNKAINEFIFDVLENADKGTSAVIRDIKIMGSADKVEGLRYIRPVKDKDGNFLPPEDQDKRALNNMLIQAYSAVLTSPHTINEVMTPIDFEYIKNDINDLHRKEPPSDLDDFDIFKDIDLKYEFMAGKAGVGQEANALVDHIRGLMTTTTLKNVYLGRGSKLDEETILDREFSEQLTDKELKAYVDDYNEGRPEKEQIKEKDYEKLRKYKIANSLSAVLNAFVDIAKDPYITRGNWTTQTTNTGNMLLRAGFHPFYVNAFMGQPVITEYIDFLTNSESKIVGDTGNMKNKFRRTLVLKDLQDRVVDIDGKTFTYEELYNVLTINSKGKVIGARLTELARADFDLGGFLYNNEAKLFGRLTNNGSEKLTEALGDIVDFHKAIFNPSNQAKAVDDYTLMDLRKQIKGEANDNVQASIINQFFEWQDLTKSVRQSTTATKIDVGGYGKSIGSLTVFDNVIGKLLAPIRENGELVGFADRLRKDDKNTLLGAYKKNIIDWTKGIMQSNPTLFLTAQPYIVNTFNQISLDVKDDILTDEEFAGTLEDNYYSYLMSGFSEFKMNKKERNYLLYDFPTELMKLMKKEDIVKDYAIFEELYVEPGDNGIIYIGMSNRKRSEEEATKITAAWRDILDDDPDLGNKLIKYAYLTSGFTMGIKQFFTYIPTSWFVENDIDGHIAKVAHDMQSHKDILEVYDHEFIDQLYRHNIDNNMLVPRLQPTAVKQWGGDSVFTLKQTKEKARRFLKHVVGQNASPSLFKLRGYNKAGRPIYTIVDPLGFKDSKSNTVYEYNFNEHVDKSLMEINNTLGRSNNEVVKGSAKLAVQPVHTFNKDVPVGEIDLEERIEDKTECNE